MEELALKVDQDPERVERVKKTAIEVVSFISDRGHNNASELMSILALVAGATIKGAARPEFKRKAYESFVQHVEIIVFEPANDKKH